MHNVIMIVAHDKYMGIGLDGGLPWSNSKDLQFFKETTMHSTVIVGSNTYKNLPKLSGRKVIVLSRDPDSVELKCDSHLVSDDYEDAIYMATMMSETKDIFIIGGAEIYKLYHDWYTHIYATFMQLEYSVADTFLYDYNKNFEFISYEEIILSDDAIILKMVRKVPPLFSAIV